MTTIGMGTLLLTLPIAQLRPISLIDLFFTSTSATCVTGLFTIPITDFTFFGHCVLLALIQIGGIGLITMTVFFMSLFVNFGLATQLMTGQLLDIQQWGHVKKIVLFIISLTVLTELIGALLTFFAIYHDYNVSQAIFLSLFHSVSSFCNAGISLFPKGIQTYNHSYLMLSTTIGLILIGGLGFLTWKELFSYWKIRWQKKWKKISLTTKIILYGTVGLTLLGALVFYCFESQKMNINNPVLIVLNSILQGLGFRGTGYTVINVMQMSNVTLFIAMVLAFIGFAPGSTGSGIKITTFVLFLATIRSAIHGRTSVEIKERQIPKDQIYKSTAIIALSMAWIFAATLVLLTTETGFGVFSIFFEATSAFATLGMSLGVTTGLSLIGKLVIITSMIVGRIGSLTLILALRKIALGLKARAITYPEERVTLS